MLAKFAIFSSLFISKLSQLTKQGKGGMIGGLIALKICPSLIRILSKRKTIILITGTNGKSTTTRMIANILKTTHSVATQIDGANMDAGIAAALIQDRKSKYAVLEVDELHLKHIAEQCNPRIIVLLNLSRDQLDRVGEIKHIADTLEFTLTKHPHTTIVANCDDVWLNYIVKNKSVIWVEAQNSWNSDNTLCPNCGAPITYSSNNWRCSTCTLKKNKPDWHFTANTISNSKGVEIKLALNLPGKINLANAAFALATTNILGINTDKAITALNQLTDIAGRYKKFKFQNKNIQLFLAKNPAGWKETLNILTDNIITEPNTQIILAINGKIADGLDLSWLWDIPFENLKPHKINILGERAPDLAVRLIYSEVEFSIFNKITNAISNSPKTNIQILANYTAFRDIFTVLENQNG